MPLLRKEGLGGFPASDLETAQSITSTTPSISFSIWRSSKSEYPQTLGREEIITLQVSGCLPALHVLGAIHLDDYLEL